MTTDKLIVPRKRARERIMVYGAEGTGKTWNYLKIAEALPDVAFFILDTDDTTERMIDEEFQGLRNVEDYLVEDWESFDKNTDEVLRLIAEEVGERPTLPREELPWVIVDMSDQTWEDVQEHFTQKVFGLDIDEYFMRAREAQGIDTSDKKVEGFSGWLDWTVIKRIYQRPWKKLSRGRNFNLFLVTGAKEVNEEKDMKDLYSFFKRQPTGEKHMGHKMHTVLFAKSTKDGWNLSTAKDRGRDMLEFEYIDDFVEDYMVKVAGWDI